MRFQSKQFSLTAIALVFTLATFTAGCLAQSTSKKSGSGTKSAAQGSDQKPAAGSMTSNQGSNSKAAAHPALADPSKANKTAPEQFYAQFNTTKGAFVVEVNRKWSPNGADRFYNMVDIGYFTDIAIFRAVDGFMFQFGIHGDPAISKHWSKSTITDDKPAGISNFPGYLTFAKTGAPNSRSAQMFVSLGNNNFLDNQGFTPFAKIVKGVEVAGKINTEYGENKGNVQGRFTAEGNAWLLKEYPRLDIIKSVEFVEKE